MTSHFLNSMDSNMNNSCLNTAAMEQSPRPDRLLPTASPGGANNNIMSPSAFSRAGLASMEARMMQDLLRSRVQTSQMSGLPLFQQEQPTMQQSNPASPVKQVCRPSHHHNHHHHQQQQQQQRKSKGLDLLGSVISNNISPPTVHVIPPSPTKKPFKPPVGNNVVFGHNHGVNGVFHQQPPMSPSTPQRHQYSNSNNNMRMMTAPPSPMMQPLLNNEPGTRLYIDSIQEWDILCGRGGRK